MKPNTLGFGEHILSINSRRFLYFVGMQLHMFFMVRHHVIIWIFYDIFCNFCTIKTSPIKMNLCIIFFQFKTKLPWIWRMHIISKLPPIVIFQWCATWYILHGAASCHDLDIVWYFCDFCTIKTLPAKRICAS